MKLSVASDLMHMLALSLLSLIILGLAGDLCCVYCLQTTTCQQVNTF